MATPEGTEEICQAIWIVSLFSAGPVKTHFCILLSARVGLSRLNDMVTVMINTLQIVRFHSFVRDSNLYL